MIDRCDPRAVSSARGLTVLLIVGVSSFAFAAAASGHTVLVERDIPGTTEVDVTEHNPHVTDDHGNLLPISVGVPFGGSLRIIIIDNVGCKADIGVAQASTFVNVEPLASDGPVLTQEFVISANEGGAGQGILPLVIGWTGDGRTIVVDGDEIVCDESAQADFRVTFDVDPSEPVPPDFEQDVMIGVGLQFLRSGFCGGGFIGPFVFGFLTLGVARFHRGRSRV